MLIDAVQCRICWQRPWRVEGMEDVASHGYIMRAWCHGAFRRWFIGEEVMQLAWLRDDFGVIARALTAFPAMLRALGPILVSIRRTRGRRLPAPTPGRLTVWIQGAA